MKKNELFNSLFLLCGLGVLTCLSAILAIKEIYMWSLVYCLAGALFSLILNYYLIEILTK